MLCKHDWVVYAKTPLVGPAQVLEYLSRYTHRTAIGNERVRGVSEREVAFTVRADDHGANCHAKRLAETGSGLLLSYIDLQSNYGKAFTTRIRTRALSSHP